MSNFGKKLSKNLIATLLVLTILTPSLMTNPRLAEAIAFVPDGDVLNTAQITNTSVQTTLNTIKEKVLDSIFYTLPKLVIHNITMSIVQWINNGFQGSPGFVEDPERFLTGVADQLAGEFIASDPKLGFLCEPFQLDIRIALNLNYSSNFRNRIGCTLTDVLKNVENFTEFTGGNFAAGGWDGFFSVTQNPQNNPYGAYALAQTELSLRTSNGREIESVKLEWGEGFLSWQDCIEPSYETTVDENGFEQTVVDENFKPVVNGCKKKGPIQTPGSLINDQLSNVFGSGLRQLELADEFNEIINALIGQLVQQVFLGGLRGSSVPPPQEVFGYCFADKNIVQTGESVKWSAQAVGTGDQSFLWSGSTPINGLTGANVTVQYNATGTKTAKVKMTTSGGQTKTVDCTTEVEVKEQEVVGYCSPNKTKAFVGDNVEWTAIGNTTSGGILGYKWGGSDPIGGLTGEKVTVQYATGGMKSANISITTAGGTETFSCSNSVDVTVEPLSGFCASDVNTASVGEDVKWTAYVTGGYGAKNYTWAGSQPLGGQSGESVTVQYQNPGQKNASVTVQSGGLIKSFSCNSIFVN